MKTSDTFRKLFAVLFAIWPSTYALLLIAYFNRSRLPDGLFPDMFPAIGLIVLGILCVANIVFSLIFKSEDAPRKLAFWKCAM